MVRPLTESLLRALVSEALGDSDESCVLAVAAPPQWSGDEVFDADGATIRVVPCVSALAVREALHRESAQNGETLVILTDRDEEDLGEEVLARVWRHRLLRPSGWEAVKHLFRIDRLDPALADHRWLVDLLVDVAPARGYPPPPSGLLDVTTAWRTLLRNGFRVDVDRPTTADLLRWSQTETARSVLDGSIGEHRDQVSRWLAKDAGPTAAHILRLVAEGRGDHLVPFGLVCDVLWPDVENSDLDQDTDVVTARARFEAPLGAKALSGPVARAWADAATKLVRDVAEGDPQGASTWLARAEHLLADLDSLNLAIASDVLPRAFTQRLELAGRHLKAILDDPREESLVPLDDAIRQVEQHLRAVGDEAARVRRVKMAGRLARRLVDPPESGAGDLAALAGAFVDDGAWVDTARDAIGDGETVEPLAEAYGRLADVIDAERRDRDRAFATAFGNWNQILPTGADELLPVERVLDEIIVPVAAHAPTLLLVLDGLSHPEAIRLHDDIIREGWTPNTPSGSRLPHVVATVPTVTAASRTSLLTGRLTTGDQTLEREEFADHAGLRDVAGGQAPRLFHKRDLGTEAGRIAPEVRDVILDTQQRVVGVVVNAVDDHLAKGGQLRLSEGLSGVKPLLPLLETAAEAGRAIVLTSDHGHVIEHGSQVRPLHGGGERWRPADPPPDEDEVEISGPRVLQGNGRVVVPAVETIRYNPNEKRGYHGGATPQEVLCPLVVLTTGKVALEGWQPEPPRRPRWWDPTVTVLHAPSPQPPPAPEPVVDERGQGALFGAETSVEPSRTVSQWIEAVLDSPILAEQRQTAGRAALDDDDIARLLSLLERAGGVASGPALSEATGLPLSRLRTKLEALRRMLNVDGYPVLTLEPDATAKLNKDLLATQFEVEV